MEKGPAPGSHAAYPLPMPPPALPLPAPGPRVATPAPRVATPARPRHLDDLGAAVRRARDLVRWADPDCGDSVTQHALVDALLAVEGVLDHLDTGDLE